VRPLALALAAVVASLTLVACGGGTPMPDQSLVATLDPMDRDALELRIHQIVNTQRRAHGLSTVAWNDTIRPIARAHSGTMARRDRFAHVIDGDGVGDRYVAAGFNCRVPAGGGRFLTGGENLFVGNRIVRWSTDSAGRQRIVETHDIESLAAAVVHGWLQSPGHRQNLLTPQWQTEAIGVHFGTDGRVWVTQNFC